MAALRLQPVLRRSALFAVRLPSASNSVGIFHIHRRENETAPTRVPIRSLSTSTNIAENADVLRGIAHLGELRELGLGSYATPVGLIQNLVEFCSATSGLPWAGGIVITTIILRLAVLPLIVKSMRNNVKLMNIQPEVQMHSDRLRACSKAGDKEGAAHATDNLQRLFQDNDCHPLRSFIPSLIQMPVFLSFFLGVRKMAELPVESLKHGGYLWFTDLTVPDPTYALPVIASLTMLATLELGSEGIKQTRPGLKTLFRIMPFALLPISASFPAGLFCYWVTANIFSLSQLLILRIPALRTALKIPEPANHPPPPSEGGKTFVESTKAAYESYLQQQASKNKSREEEVRNEALKKMKIPKKPTGQ